MGRRTSKKSKKIKLTDKHTPTSMNKLCGIIMPKSGTYKAADKFMRKARANAQLGELFTPIMEDYPSEFEQDIISSVGDWHMGSNHNPIEDIIRAMESIRDFNCSCHVFPTNGNCAVCGFFLTYKYPEDYPDEWKFCCYCLPKAKTLIDGTIKPTTPKLKAIYDKITLVRKSA